MGDVFASSRSISLMLREFTAGHMKGVLPKKLDSSTLDCWYVHQRNGHTREIFTGSESENDPAKPYLPM